MIGDLNGAQETIGAAIEDCEAIGEHLQESLEAVSNIASKVLAVQEWLTSMAGQLVDQLGAGNSAVEGLQGVAEKSGEVIEAIGNIGLKLEEAIGVTEAGNTALDEFLTELGALA
jgi:phage-related protein